MSTDQFLLSPSLLPQEEVFRLKTLGILELLAESNHMELNRTAARDALFQAEQEIPGSWETTWASRLVQVGKEIGLWIQPVNHTLPEIEELTEHQTPILTLVESQEGPGEWVLFQGDLRGTTLGCSENRIQWDDSRSVTAQLESNNGEQNGTVPRLWVTVQPLMPFQQLRDGPKEETEIHHGPPPLSRLLKLFQQDRNDLWVIVIFSLGTGIFSLATPIAVEAIVSTVQGGTQVLMQPVIALSLVLLVFLGLAAILRVFQAVVVEYLQQRIFVKVSIDLANRIPQVRLGDLDKAHAPELVNRFFDVLTVQKASAVLLLDGISVVLQTAIGLMVLAFFNPYLLGFDIVLIGAIAFIIFVLGRGAIRTSIKESYAKYHVASWLEEMARHPLAFKMGGGRSFALHRANELAGKYVKARKAHFKILFRQVLFAVTLQAVASAALFGLGGWLVINRGLTLGQLVAAELILTMVVGSFIKLGKSLESYYDLMAAMDKLGHLIDLPLETTVGEQLPHTNKPMAVLVENVSFHHKGSERVLIRNMSFEVQPGETIALVGPHGSGKSSFLDILYGIHLPTTGRIDFDGRDVRSLHPESIRAQVSTIKGLEVFEGSLLENIRLGRRISNEDIRSALKAVDFYDEVMGFPDGLNTELSTGGSPLSVGQIRRLMMTRAIVGRPRLLLIDEAFEDLNEEIRGPIIDYFIDPKQPWTLILVTHNRDVANRCDRQISFGPQGDGVTR